jgi:hypothetical protein
MIMVLCKLIKLRSSAIVTASCLYPSSVKPNNTRSSFLLCNLVNTSSAFCGVITTQSIVCNLSGSGRGISSGVFSTGFATISIGFSLFPKNSKLAQPLKLIDARRLIVRVSQRRALPVDFIWCCCIFFCFR